MGISLLLLPCILLVECLIENRRRKSLGFQSRLRPVYTFGAEHLTNTFSPSDDLKVDLAEPTDDLDDEEFDLINLDRGLDAKVGANSSIHRKDLEFRRIKPILHEIEATPPNGPLYPWDLDSDDEEFPKAPNYDDLSAFEIDAAAKKLLEEDKDDGKSPLDEIAERRQKIELQRKLQASNAWKSLVQAFEIEKRPNQCIGCGVHLQVDNERVKGYIERPVYQMLKETKTEMRCQRCSHMRSGLIFKAETVALGNHAVEASRETVSIIRNALALRSNSNVAIVYFMDVLDMHFEQGLADLIVSRRKKRKGKTLFYIALNKVDLLPRHSRIRILRYIHKMITTKAPELKLKPRHVFLMSSKRNSGVNLFLSVLLDTAYKMRSKIFLVGPTNAGKSTFMNLLSNLEHFKMDKRQAIAVRKQSLLDKGLNDKTAPGNTNILSTSVIPGTTLSPMKIAIAPGLILYDTPGIVVPESLTSHLTPAELKVAVTATVGKCRPIRIGPGYSLLLGEFARIDVVKGRPYFFTPYVSKHVNVVVKKWSKVPTFLASNPFGCKRLFYSSGDVPSAYGKPIHIKGAGWQEATVDICIKGLGFVAVAGALKLELVIETMPEAQVHLREPLMPFDALPFSLYNKGRLP